MIKFLGYLVWGLLGFAFYAGLVLTVADMRAGYDRMTSEDIIVAALNVALVIIGLALFAALIIFATWAVTQ